MSGTIGGKTYGVAKNVALVAVKVLNAAGQGQNSDVIKGIQWVADTVTQKGLRGKAVMNMSLGGPKADAVNDAVQSLNQAGVVACVAAGNENQDATLDSPASAEGAITVGAIDQSTDGKASFSNYGPRVDIFAPGVHVLSVGIQNTTASRFLDGTSMATPHITGLAAYLMALGNVTTPQDVLASIQALARQTGAQVLDNQPQTTNLIANNGHQ